MIERVAAAIERHQMTARGPRIGVAVSGGADSVFLLRCLHELGLAVAILHVNHGLRGADSASDEEFVRDLAHRFQLPIHVCAGLPEPGNLEQEARRCRYEFFSQKIASGECDVIATGHTLDDQAETVLSRFIRGAGTAGLSGIRPVTPSGIVRPLIDLRRSDVRDWLRERDISWREDLSNTCMDFQRNRIRCQYLPELAAGLNPALPQVLASTASWAAGEEDYWSGELDRLEAGYFIRAAETVVIPGGPLSKLPLAVQRRLLRRAIERVRGSLRAIDFNHIEAIRRLTATQEGSGRIQIPDMDVYRSFDWLRLAPIGFDSRLERDFEASVLIPGRTEVPERGLFIEMELVANQDVYNGHVQGLDWERCAGSLLLRNWRPGDRYQPVGRLGAEKIKTLFQEFRVPLWERRTWPVIARTSSTQIPSILWTRRFGFSAEFAACPDSRNILTIREVRESNAVPATSMELKRARDDQFRPVEPGAEVL